MQKKKVNLTLRSTSRGLANQFRGEKKTLKFKQKTIPMFLMIKATDLDG